MTTCRRCGHDWLHHIVSKMPDTVGCEECQTDEPLSACFPGRKENASREDILRAYNSVLSQQDALLRHMRHDTGDIWVVFKLSRLETVLASLPQEVGQE